MQLAKHELSNIKEDMLVAEQGLQNTSTTDSAIPENLPKHGEMDMLNVAITSATNSVTDLPNLFQYQQQNFINWTESMKDIDPSWTLEDIKRAETIPNGKSQLKSCLITWEQTEKKLEYSHKQLILKSDELKNLSIKAESLNKKCHIATNRTPLEIKAITQGLQEIQKDLQSKMLAEHDQTRAAFLLENQQGLIVSNTLAYAFILIFILSFGLGAYGFWVDKLSYLVTGGSLMGITISCFLLIQWLKKNKNTAHEATLQIVNDAVTAIKRQDAKIENIFNNNPALLNFIEQEVGEYADINHKNTTWVWLTPDLIVMLQEKLEEERNKQAEQQYLHSRLHELNESISQATLQMNILENEHKQQTKYFENANENLTIMLSRLHLPEDTPADFLHSLFERIANVKTLFHIYEESSMQLAKTLTALASPFAIAGHLPFFQAETIAWLQTINDLTTKSTSTGEPASIHLSLKPDPETLLVICLNKIHADNNLRGISISMARILPMSNAIDLYTHGLRVLDQLFVTIKTAFAKEQENKEQAARNQERLEQFTLLQQKYLQYHKKEEQAQVHLHEIQLSWSQWLADCALNQHLSPETALEALGVMEQILSKQAEKEKLQHTIFNLQATAHTFINDIKNIALKAGLTEAQHNFFLEPCLDKLHYVFTGNDFEELKHDLHLAIKILDNAVQSLEEAEKNMVRLENIKNRMDELSEQAAKEEAALKIQQSELENILKTGLAKMPEEFQLRFAQWETRQKQKQLLFLLESAATDLSIDSEEFIASFGQTTHEEQEIIYTNTQEEILGKEQQIKSLVKDTGAIQERQDNLINSRKTASLRQEEAGLQEKLQILISEWQSLALARHMFLEAKNVFEKDNQHSVIGTAGNILKQITAGEYQSVQLDVEKEQILAVHKNGTLKDPEAALSQGTREQLYLSLRLAYIANHAKKAEPVPVIMDDILVNFDKKRMINTAEVLANFSQSNQILFFTCHETTAKTLLSISEQMPVRPTAFTISNGKIEAIPQ